MSEGQVLKGSKGLNYIDDDLSMWWDYKKSNSEFLRNELVGHYSGYAKSIAYSVYSRYASSGIAKEDCTQLAFLGLIKAISRYDIDMGVVFTTFSYRYIKGEILRGIEKYSEQFGYNAQRKRMQRERMDSLSPKGVSCLADFVSLTIDLGVSFLLDSLHDGDSVDKKLIYQVQFEDKLATKKILSYCKSLVDREREVIHLHYFRDMSFSEIADALNLSKSRVSQIHASAVQNIRVSLSPNKKFQLNT
ncbi:sigma-70 family RNA polymerase sigma factor [Ketobacter alkanivorans]|uniref:RNA polymerase sigma-70 domain-containing protein n=1 Tax=Ketobacter alkanivorans TaxID=1917421 RepID=A0A2K9LL12_9GAMM|nr:sigma-70 family RNA polymerase sigma factor [Ketobacter alkanivorans]AUM12950.1 hypothetical protein Kalk_11170 [Ketobacter alkanivorans]